MTVERNPITTRFRAALERLATGSPVRDFLRVPLFYKILVGNAAIVLLGTVASGALVIRFMGGVELVSTLQAIAMGAVLSLILGLALNALLIVAALSPLETIKETARRVEAGERSCRAPDALLADRDLRRFAKLFNRMLDSLAMARRREQRLALQVLEAEEQDRHGISKELYDDVAQRLAAILLLLQANNGDGLDADELSAARTEIVDTLELIRRLARHLRPPELDELGLMPALRALARTVSEGRALSVHIARAPTGVDLDPEASRVLYRIVREALTNAASHAEASLVDVTFSVKAGRLVTEILDDGRGFDPTDVQNRPNPGLGLLAMRERAAYAGGELTVDSEPSGGTRIRAALPIRPARAGVATPPLTLE